MGFFLGIRAYGKAFGILFSRRFWWFLLFPVLILWILFIGGNFLVSYAGEYLYGFIEQHLKSWVDEITWLQWVSGFSNVFIKIVLRIGYFFLFATFGGYIVLILMSPVYSWLSERTETYLSGKAYPFSWRRLFWEIFRGLGIALRNMFVQLLFFVLFFLCSFIPVAGVLAPFALFFTSAYFYGFSFMDYAMERKRFNVKESVRYVNRHMALTMGIGSVFALILMIPWIRIMACCFVSLLSVIASMVALHETETTEMDSVMSVKD
ncbi:MAG: EI24 domain-containing protein [Odoribacter sp.]|nr:EI24 domain-containing protein [Odoribacter sp.]